MDPRLIFSRHVWALNVTLVALIAMLVAGAANQRLASALAQEPTCSSIANSPARTQAAASSPLSAILDRDLFNAHELAAAASAPAAPIVKATALQLKLLGIAFFGPAHPSNLATILDLAARKIGLFKKGDAIAPDAIVDDVQVDHIILARKDGAREELLFKDSAIAPSRPSRPVPVFFADTPSHYVPPQPMEDGAVTQIGPNSWRVSKDFIDRAMTNQLDLVTTARLIPVFEGEGDARRIVGFQLLNIRRGTVFIRMGFRDGDVIRRINGVAFTSMEAALGLLQSLRQETGFHVEIERAGAPLTLNYSVE